MVCDRDQNIFIRTACRLGVNRTAGRSAALAGGAAVAGFAAAVAIGRGLDRLADREQQGNSASTSDLPDTASKTTVRPNTPPADGRCAGCEVGSEKPGLWFTIGGERYCADCASDAARKANVRLSLPEAKRPVRQTPTYASAKGEKRPEFGPDALPTPSTTDGAPVEPTRPVTVESGSSPVTLDLIDGSTKALTLNGVKVFKYEDGSDVGLAITPVIAEIEGEGARVVPDSWQITHTATGRQVADLVFNTPEEGFLPGTLLSQFNWLGGNENLRREVTTMKATIEAYKKAMAGARQAFAAAEAN